MVHRLKIVFRKDVRVRRVRVTLVVGTLRVAINHGDTLIQGKWTFREGVKIPLTHLVPYGLSTYASVATIRNMERTSEQNARPAVRKIVGACRLHLVSTRYLC